VTFAFIQAEKAHHPVRILCRALDVSASGFYAWQQRSPSLRSRTDRRLRTHLRATHAASRGTYGSPRLHEALQQAGHAVGRNRVIRLMRADQLVGRPRKRFRLTTAADPDATPAANHLARAFRPRRPNTVWAGDITALPTPEGWLYLAVLLDLYSRRVVGWAIDTSLETALVLTAWRRALAGRRTAPRLHHSDRGTQYTSACYQAALAAHRVRCSMSRRGNCYDNAVVESFFRTLKLDLGERIAPTRQEAARRIGAYIDGFYNTRRLHSTLGYRSPVQFEREHSPAS
jgi:putative transposase